MTTFAANPAPIEVAAVSKIFPGGVQALNQASFTIAEGERACLLGPNGAGKTTIIRLLTGALNPTAGTTRIYGATAREPAFLAAKRRVGIVPQGPGMYRDIKVGEYLRLVQQLYDRGDVGEVVVAFGLSEYQERPMAQLSGGYQRRLALAAALLPAPDLLLLDEPTVGLDPVAAREVHDYLRSVMVGRTTLLCTHNLAEAEALCESAIILQNGRVLLHDRIENLRRRTQPQIALEALEGPQRLLDALTHLNHPAALVDGQVRLLLSEPQQQVPELLRALLAAELNVYECHTITPSLEDLFLDIVGGSHDRA
ncbi:MAG TPA: ABC transporter ATP-binding protein [Herpetosiphonaceae bacterium]